MYTISDCYILAYCFCLVALAMVCRKMFRSMFAKLGGRR